MIQINELSKCYKEEKVFDNFTMNIQEGEKVGIVGPSGCGKSTLLRMIAGLDNDYTGSIFIQSELMTGKIQPFQRNIALVMQEPVLWSHMNIKQNIMYSLSTKEQKNPDKQKLFMQICERLGIDKLINRYPGMISGGQAKRVAFARAIMADKKIWLLDEPLSNVDVETKKHIISYINEEFKADKTILYVSHEQSEIDNLCERVITI